MERLAVDIGGTFVDALAFDRESGQLSVEKTSTTPDAPADGVIDAIGGLGVDLTNAEAFVHGTTLGLNAFLEREGAKTGIITNEGFRDVYEIGRTNLEPSAMYDIDYQKPEPLVQRRRRRGVPGRIDVDGEVMEPLDEDAVLDAAEELIEEWNVESIAISFLHAYTNPDHERRAAESIKTHYPDIPISVSSDITAEYREYERTSTAVFDAYIKPIFQEYVERLDAALREGGFEAPFYITRSGGGTISADKAKRTPVQTIMSGPAGGIIGASKMGALTDRTDLITVDIGGTSTDTCVIEDGKPAIQYEANLEHLPMMIPVYDIRTIGAGGGSIARVESGLLKAGPKSAGADPGPICYGRGGERPTVTDAALGLGYINPDGLLGGELELDKQAALGGIEAELANPLGTSIRDACTGVLEVMTAKTVGAIQEITVERGRDPRDFSLFLFGGAGPLLGSLFARELDIPDIIVPTAPSVFSAWGMLMADVVVDTTEMQISVLKDLDRESIEASFQRLERTAREDLRDEGFEKEDMILERSVEMRYFGQEHTVDVPAEGIASIAELSDRFESVHRDRYGHTMDDPPQLVSLRVRGIGETDKPSLTRDEPVSASPTSTETRDAYCFAREQELAFEVFKRSTLETGQDIVGPAVIEEPTTTTVCFSDQTARVGPYGNLLVRQGGEAHG